jgi:hypothetical protein
VVDVYCGTNVWYSIEYPSVIRTARDKRKRFARTARDKRKRFASDLMSFVVSELDRGGAGSVGAWLIGPCPDCDCE